jgi:hypothetical protein
MDIVGFKYTMSSWKSGIHIGEEIHNPDNLQGSFIVASIVGIESYEGDIVVYGTGIPVKLFN